MIGQFLHLCDTAEGEGIAQWLTANAPPPVIARGGVTQVAQVLTTGCQSDGGYHLEDIADSSASAIAVMLQGRQSHLWYQLAIALDGEGRIARIAGPQPADPPRGSLPGELSDQALAGELAEEVAAQAAADRFSGIAVVARGSRSIASAIAGYADRSTHRPITPRTQFSLGSIGKLFTAVAAGQLVDSHKLAYSDTVGRFFPDYPDSTVRDKVTVGMLLSHTAGLGDFLMRRPPAMMRSGIQRAAELMPLYDQDEPQFEPGTRWSYSNAGFALVGAIVEKVSGEPYPDYLRKHIFRPAGMKDSDPNNVPHLSTHRVVPYTHQTPQGPSKDWQEAPPDLGSPAGGALSTAEDLVRFAEALRSGRLVSLETLAQMTAAHGTPDGPAYGYGMGIQDVHGRIVVGHNGGFPGVSTQLSLLVGTPYTVVVLANQDPPAHAFVAAKALALVAAKADADSRGSK